MGFFFFLSATYIVMLFEAPSSPILRNRWTALSFTFSLALLCLGLSLVLILVFGNKFFAAFLFPLRWVSRILGSVASAVAAIGTFVIRRASWSIILKIAMGLEGYQFAIPMIERRPSYISANCVKYEDIPVSAERRALKNRSDWIEKHVEDVCQTFSKLVVTAGDISLLLGKIEEDQTLVHAAYYTDDQCIAQIADWLAAKDSRDSS